jgi:hypothetical protein
VATEVGWSAWQRKAMPGGSNVVDYEFADMRWDKGTVGC